MRHSLRRALEEASAGAVEQGELPSNNATTTDTPVMAEDTDTSAEGDTHAQTTELGEVLTDEESGKLDEARKVDEARIVLNGEEAQESFSLLAGLRASLEGRTQSQLISLEEELQAHIDTTQALVNLDGLQRDIHRAGDTIVSLSNLDLVMNRTQAFSNTEKALIQITGDVMVAGTSTDANLITPAMESDHSTDKRGIISRIIDNIMAMAKKFLAWLQGYFFSASKIEKAQEAKVQAVQKQVEAIKRAGNEQASQAPAAHQATSLPPVKVNSLRIDETRSATTPAEFSSFLDAFIQVQKRWVTMAIQQEQQRYAVLFAVITDYQKGSDVDLAKIQPPKFNNLMGGTESTIANYPGLVQFSVGVDTPTPQDASLDTLGAWMRSTQYTTEQLELGAEVEVLVPKINAIEAMVQAFANTNKARRAQDGKFKEVIDQHNQIITKAEQALAKFKKDQEFEKALAVAAFLDAAIRFESAALKANHLMTQSFMSEAQGYLKTLLGAYDPS